MNYSDNLTQSLGHKVNINFSTIIIYAIMSLILAWHRMCTQKTVITIKYIAKEI